MELVHNRSSLKGLGRGRDEVIISSSSIPAVLVVSCPRAIGLNQIIILVRLRTLSVSTVFWGVLK